MKPINSSSRSILAAMVFLLASPVVLAKPPRSEKQQTTTQEAKHPKTDLDALYQEARNGNAEAQFQLAKILKQENGFVTNPDVIARWFLTAAKQGHQDAITFVSAISMDCPPHISKTLKAEVDAFAAGFRVGLKGIPAK
jgi:hypothetical protein